MPNLKINNKTYSGVNEVHIPLANGSGNEDFAYITSETKSITENGTHDVKHYGTVNVNVPNEGITPTGTKTITENGTYDVTEYASAKVEVPSEEPNIQSLNVTANGTYTAPSGIDGYSPITVNVPTESGGIDTSDATATANDMAKDVTAYVNGEKVTGALPVKGGADAGILDENTAEVMGDSTIIYAVANGTNPRMILDENSSISVGIKPDKFGDAKPEDVATGKIFTSVSGYRVRGTGVVGGIDTSDATATTYDIAKGVTAYVKGKKVTGELESISSVVTDGSKDDVVAYCTPEDKTFGVWAIINNNTRRIISPKFQVIANFDGNLMGDATAEDVVKGKTFSSVNGMKLTGTYEPTETGGGGGLPAGITALATDTFTPASDISNSLYELEHGLGVVPNFFIVMVSDVPALSGYTKSVLQVQGVRRPVGTNAATVSTMYVSAYEAVSALTQNLQSAEANDKWTADSLSFDLYSYALKAGYTYRWICGVAEGLG